MSDIKLTEIQAEETPREDYSLRQITKAKQVKEVKYVTEKNEVSKNIQRFDKKAVIYKENPYSYNSISLKKVTNISPSANQMISNPLYNSVGKLLGLDTAKEWNQYYDKVFKIVEWARKKVKDDKKIAGFILQKARTVPELGSRRIDDIYINSQLQ